MKPVPRTIVIVGLIALAVAIGWWMSSSSKLNDEILAPTTQSPAVSQAALPSTVTTEVVQPYARTPMLGLADPRWKEYNAKRKLDPSFEWRTPIEFYGKVVDEHEQPVAGATIETSWNGTSDKYGGDGVGKRTLASDGNGMFTLSGVQGKGITVYVIKEGYYRRSEANGWFEYTGFWAPEFIEPDRNNPVIFRLVKRPIGEPTLRVRQRSIATAPSWAKHIDLLAQPSETSGGGDFAMRIVRPPSPGYQTPFDWELKIEGTDGAEFIESKDEFMLRAPDEGYQKAISKNFKQARGNSIETIKFYVRNKARRLYAAVSVEVTPYYPNHATKEDAACFIVTGTVNPNDSPNVEYDPEKDIREMANK